MKKISFCKKSLLLLVFISLSITVIAQNTWTEKSAEKWLKKSEWKNGLKQSVHFSVDKKVFAEQYHKNRIVWDKAFAFMRDSDLANLKTGKYIIDGDNAFATITEAPSKEFEKSGWESHRKYIDLQYVIKGKEKIGVAPITTAKVVKPYDEAKDGANYETDGLFFIAEPNTFFLFFPNDVHRPNIKVDGYEVVKKLVIKIKMVY